MDESRIAKRFKTYDIRKGVNFKVVYLSFYWLNDSWTREFELITLVDLNSYIVYLNS